MNVISTRPGLNIVWDSDMEFTVYKLRIVIYTSSLLVQNILRHGVLYLKLQGGKVAT